MNGTVKMSIPKFLEGEVLPAGYFDEPNPYEDQPSCKLDLRALGEYIKKTGKKSGWELTKEEMKAFEVV